MTISNSITLKKKGSSIEISSYMYCDEFPNPCCRNFMVRLQAGNSRIFFQEGINVDQPHDPVMATHHPPRIPKKLCRVLLLLPRHLEPHLSRRVTQLLDQPMEPDQGSGTPFHGPVLPLLFFTLLRVRQRAILVWYIVNNGVEFSVGRHILSCH